MQEAQDLAESGRGTDTVMAHMSLGEVVIPRAFLDDPEAMQVLRQMFEAAGANMAEFTVGDPANKINPETGYPEFFFKKIFRTVAKIAPIAAAFIPGIGPLGAAAIGAASGLASGGGVKGALSGALGGYAAGGGGSILGNALGATGATATGLGSGLLGAAAGGASGGLKGALLGGALGGAGGYANAGGFDNTIVGRGLQDLYTGASGALDRVNSGVSDLYNGSALQGAFRSGQDALQSATGISATSSAPVSAAATGAGPSKYGTDTNFLGRFSLGNAEIGGANDNAGIGGANDNAEIGGANDNNSTILTGATNTGESPVGRSTSSYVAPLLSALLGARANDQAAGAFLAAQQANRDLLAPYASGFSFTPGDLTQDPGYQFNLAEGERAQDRANLARGGYFSGNALREAQIFGQGLADNTYNAAFSRALQGRAAGLTGALASAEVNTDIGNIRANSATNTSNLNSGALGALLGGNSFSNTGALQGGINIQDLLRRGLLTGAA